MSAARFPPEGDYKPGTTPAHKPTLHVETLPACCGSLAFTAGHLDSRLGAIGNDRARLLEI